VKLDNALIIEDIAGLMHTMRPRIRAETSSGA